MVIYQLKHPLIVHSTQPNGLLLYDEECEQIIERGDYITKNQIAYLEYLEKKRNNQKNEQLTESRDFNNVRYNFASLDETRRHNRATEGQAAQSLVEQSRHNVATESTELAKVNESYRHNLASEKLTADQNQIRLSELKETVAAHRNQETENRRSHLAQENEQHRANLENERLKAEQNRYMHDYYAETVLTNKYNAETSRRQADVAAANVQLGYAKLGEDIEWHNMQNSARLAELRDLSSYRSVTTTETQRHNERTESLTQSKQNEDKRHNIAGETETKRSNMAKEKETNRHNKYTEGIQTANTVIRGIDEVLRIIEAVPTWKGKFNNGKSKQIQIEPWELDEIQEYIPKG